ncbi:uncharacterized protein F5Z01DRAFT_139731 [Emericellopsis atlantica]|uniref:Glucose-methanol-choline oxidoreductase N-terminal domain-containing protein n=1 Tax=Emericellopsis atlantica TaxID=2614577 RepID=A0A9P8CN63_9HYPO|nr:uncharacterized protein F5Z01DRAFT_139731 [Emericellopsis atlantica]KAG9253454.1 hypothetical protein F5Z01DRAFT_139731 [Emericellopsis atlantica]
MASSVYDFAIVGGGLSGCVLASRLHEYDPEAKILLLEAGGETRDRPEVREPQVLNLGGDLDWAYESEPVSHLGGRTVTLNAGKGLGGSSAINSCGWQRGAAADYDEWAALVGDERYSYKGQLPYFRKSERSFDDVNPEHHGKDGNIHVKTSGAANRIYPLSKQNAAAWEELGVTGVPNLDQNAGQNLGRAYLCEARREGKRQWAADAYALEGVEVRLNTLVAKIVLDNSDSVVRATGVELADGTSIAAKEVIVSAGAFRSPQLLLLSGVGLAEDLKQVGIEPVVDLPEVGQGLMDHMLFFQHWRVKDPLAGYTMGSPNELWAQPQYAQGMPFDWIVNTGVPEDELKAAIKKDEGSEPDSTTHSLLKTPRTFLEYIVAYVKLPFPGTTMDAEHITTGVVSFLPTSRGSVSLRSSNPQEQPKIDMNYLSTEVDRFVYRQGLRNITKFMLGTQFSEYVSGETVPDILPAEPATLEDSDEKLDQRLAMASGTTWHACGSCAMGKVVDTAFRVHGVEGLRVVDASVFPVPLSAHIQAPLYALTEQAAAMIAGKA